MRSENGGRQGVELISYQIDSISNKQYRQPNLPAQVPALKFCFWVSKRMLEIHTKYCLKKVRLLYHFFKCI